VAARLASYCIALIAFSGAAAAPAYAHGFGARYDLPIPLSFYVFAAGTTVALSFVMVALLLRTTPSSGGHPLVVLMRSGWSRRVGAVLAVVARAVASAYFLLMIAAGLFGIQSAERNFIVVSVWIVGWVAISLGSALVGDVWRLLNPWNALFAAAERIYLRLHPGRGLKPLASYPAALDRWPALFLFVAFAWMELVWGGRDVPARLAQAMLAYSGMTWLGMILFGRQAWLRGAEMFGIVFGIFARFAPLAPVADAGLAVRLPASGLLDDRDTTPAIMLLVVTLLATVTFDGLLETPLWARVDIAVLDAPDDSVLWTVFNFSDAGALRFERSIGLLLFVALFCAAYLSICKAMALAAGGKYPTAALARRFVFTLLPISIAYHIAHYFSYLFNGGQLVIPLLSDPFGFGWDLIGTASYRPDIGFVGPVLQWYVAVGAIVVGHVIAVYLAHVVALSTFVAPRVALRSQMPIVALMVGYTMVSLWILSQPIVETSPGG